MAKSITNAAMRTQNKPISKLRYVIEKNCQNLTKNYSDEIKRTAPERCRYIDPVAKSTLTLLSSVSKRNWKLKLKSANSLA